MGKTNAYYSLQNNDTRNGYRIPPFHSFNVISQRLTLRLNRGACAVSRNASVSIGQAQSVIFSFVDDQEEYFKELKCERVILSGRRRLHAIDIQNLCFARWTNMLALPIRNSN
jgi:hypothetical protein